MKKKIVLTVVSSVIALIVIGIIIANFVFIIRQLDPYKAYFNLIEHSLDLSDFKFTNEWVEYLHQNSTFKPHYRSIVIAFFNVIFEIIILIYLIRRVYKIWKK